MSGEMNCRPVKRLQSNGSSADCGSIIDALDLAVQTIRPVDRNHRRAATFISTPELTSLSPVYASFEKTEASDSEVFPPLIDAAETCVAATAIFGPVDDLTSSERPKATVETRSRAETDSPLQKKYYSVNISVIDKLDLAVDHLIAAFGSVEQKPEDTSKFRSMPDFRFVIHLAAHNP